MEEPATNSSPRDGGTKPQHPAANSFPITDEIRATAKETFSLFNAVYPPGSDEWAHPQAKRLVIKCSSPKSAASLAGDLSEFGHSIVAAFKIPFADYWCRQDTANWARVSSDARLVEKFVEFRNAGRYGNSDSQDEVQSVLGSDRIVDLPRVFPTWDPESDELIGFLAHYVPHYFTHLIDDLTRSRLQMHTVTSGEKHAIESFLKAFTPERVVHVSPMDPSDEPGTPIDDAHDSVFKLLRLVAGLFAKKQPNGPIESTPLASISAEPSASKREEIPDSNPQTVPEILVRCVRDDLRVTVDGTPCILTNRPKRALAVISILQKKEWFSVHEFSRLYRGKLPDATEARRDFDTPISKLKESIPGLMFEPDNKGRRQLRGLRLVVKATKGELEAVLGRLRNIPISEEDRQVMAVREKPRRQSDSR